MLKCLSLLVLLSGVVFCQMSEAETPTEKVQKDLLKASKAIGLLNAQLQQLQETVRDLRIRQTDSSERAIKSVEQRIAELEKQRDEINKAQPALSDPRVDQLMSTLQYLELEAERNRTSQQEVGRLAKKIESLEAELARTLRDNDSLSARVNRAGGNSAAKFPHDATQKLKGRWQRLEGGYILEVDQVRPPREGGVLVGYFSQDLLRWVRVLQANVTPLQDGRSRFNVEMWDDGYYGSKYDLVYDPQSDTMTGTYTGQSGNPQLNVRFRRVTQN